MTFKKASNIFISIAGVELKNVLPCASWRCSKRDLKRPHHLPLSGLTYFCCFV